MDDEQQFMDDDMGIGYDENQYYDPYTFDTGKSMNPYEILPQSSIFNQVSALVEQTSQTVAQPFGWSLILLREFKWQTEYLGDYFQNKAKYQKAIGYDPTLLTTENAKKLNMVGDCIICMESLPLFHNICKDGFCRNCWAGHIEQHLNNMNPFLKCMSCTAPVLFETIKDILNSPDYAKLYQRYQKQICQCFTNTNRSFKCCPGADCNYCIKCENYGVSTVKCICGKSFCFKCQNDDHSPCTCDQRVKWCDIVLKEEANAKWIAQNTKLCPWCNKAVERSQGCNFMACLCGKSFCYMCSKPWEPDHKDHFKCHIYRKKPEDEENREKAVLQKLNFFAEKYLNTNAVVVSLKKFDAFQKRKLLYEKLNVDLPESDFIDQAYKFAIECCESLKWIYVYTYFVEILGEDRKKRFEFSQGQYESFKEELLKKLSFDLKNFFVKLDKHVEANHGKVHEKDKKTFLDSFWTLKTSIINYYKFTQQFKQKFMQEIQSLDESAIKRSYETSSKQVKSQQKKDSKKAAKKK